MRLSRAALVPGLLLAVTAGGFVGGTSATAGTPLFTVVSGYTHVVKLGPSADTSCDINYDLYLPTDVSAAHQVPAILTTNGFGGSKTDQAQEAALWASHDYVVLSYSGLGFGGSTCLVYTDDPDWDGRAASQLIDFLAKQPGVLQDSRGPIVGTWGGSYGGGFQFALASVDTRVRAMIPEITWNDLTYSLLPNNDSATFDYTNSPPGVEKVDWTSLFYALGNAEPALNPGHSGWTNTSSGKKFNGTPPNPACPGYQMVICKGEYFSVAQGYGAAKVVARLRHASAQYELFNKYPAGSLHFPATMLAQGQADTLFDFQDGVANYLGFKSKGAPVKLVLKEGGHSGPGAPGEYNNSDPTKGYLTQEELNWFDHYLKNTGVSTGPEIEYFRDWVQYDTSGSAQPAYASAAAWPVGTVKNFYLSGKDALVTSKHQIRPGTVTFTNTLPPGPASYSETSEFQSTSPISMIPPTDPPGTFAAYSTAPLRNAIDSVGIPTIDVHIADANPLGGANPSLNVVIFGKIYDVAADGSVTLVHRIVSPVRIADTTKTEHINLPGVAHEYAAGHRIELVLATTDSAFAGSRAIHALSITVDPAHPTVLSLPVLDTTDLDTTTVTVTNAAIAGRQVTGTATRAAGVSGAVTSTTLSTARVKLAAAQKTLAVYLQAVEVVGAGLLLGIALAAAVRRRRRMAITSREGP